MEKVFREIFYFSSHQLFTSVVRVVIFLMLLLFLSSGAPCVCVCIWKSGRGMFREPFLLKSETVDEHFKLSYICRSKGFPVI